jgi:hypothetical protein
MYEQTVNFWDIAIVAVLVVFAAVYVYRKIIGKKGSCGGGCDSCPSAVDKNKK